MSEAVPSHYCYIGTGVRKLVGFGFILNFIFITLTLLRVACFPKTKIFVSEILIILI